MRDRFWAETVGGIALIAVMLAAGCTTGPPRGKRDAVPDLQEKVHQEQLSEASRRDAASAKASLEDPKSRRPRPPKPREGQSVIDQPIRR